MLKASLGSSSAAAPESELPSVDDENEGEDEELLAEPAEESSPSPSPSGGLSPPSPPSPPSDGGSPLPRAKLLEPKWLRIHPVYSLMGFVHLGADRVCPSGPGPSGPPGPSAGPFSFPRVQRTKQTHPAAVTNVCAIASSYSVGDGLTCPKIHWAEGDRRAHAHGWCARGKPLRRCRTERLARIVWASPLGPGTSRGARAGQEGTRAWQELGNSLTRLEGCRDRFLALYQHPAKLSQQVPLIPGAQPKFRSKFF